MKLSRLITKRNRLSLSLMALAYVLGLLISCSVHRKFVPPQVELLNLGVKDFTLSHIDYDASVRVYNPNLEDLRITSMSYSLLVNGVKLVDGAEQMDVKIGQHQEVVIPLRLKCSIFSVLRFISSVSKNKQVDFSLKGIISGLADNGQMFSLPFSEKGKLNLNQLNPGIPLQYKY